MSREDLRVVINESAGYVEVELPSGPDQFFHLRELKNNPTRQLAISAVACAIHELWCKYGEVPDSRLVWQFAYEWSQMLVGRREPKDRAKIDQAALQQFMSKMIQQA